MAEPKLICGYDKCRKPITDDKIGYDFRNFGVYHDGCDVKHVYETEMDLELNEINRERALFLLSEGKIKQGKLENKLDA